MGVGYVTSDRVFVEESDLGFSSLTDWNECC